MERVNTDLAKKELTEALHDIALELAIEDVKENCADELRIVAGALIHFAEKYGVPVSMLTEEVVGDVL